MLADLLLELFLAFLSAVFHRFEVVQAACHLAEQVHVLAGATGGWLAHDGQRLLA